MARRTATKREFPGDAQTTEDLAAEGVVVVSWLRRGLGVGASLVGMGVGIVLPVILIDGMDPEHGITLANSLFALGVLGFGYGLVRTAERLTLDEARYERIEIERARRRRRRTAKAAEDKPPDAPIEALTGAFAAALAKVVESRVPPADKTQQ